MPAQDNVHNPDPTARFENAAHLPRNGQVFEDTDDISGEVGILTGARQTGGADTYWDESEPSDTNNS